MTAAGWRGNHSREGQPSGARHESARNPCASDDGVTTDTDPAFSRLPVWFDRNRDGVSQADELGLLQGLGIQSLGLDYRSSERRDSVGCTGKTPGETGRLVSAGPKP